MFAVFEPVVNRFSVAMGEDSGADDADGDDDDDGCDDDGDDDDSSRRR